MLCRTLLAFFVFGQFGFDILGFLVDKVDHCVFNHDRKNESKAQYDEPVKGGGVIGFR